MNTISRYYNYFGTFESYVIFGIIKIQKISKSMKDTHFSMFILHPYTESNRKHHPIYLQKFLPVYFNFTSLREKKIDFANDLFCDIEKQRKR